MECWALLCGKLQLGGVIAKLLTGWDRVLHNGKVNGNWGCTASHRSILDLIAYHRWGKVLVFEDDFEAIYDDTLERFDAMWPEVPSDWDLVYLGGHYADAPIARVSDHVIRCGPMHTTSSYAITYEHAKRMAPYICETGPIDTLYSGFAAKNNHYILQPRLFVQYSSFSDLTEQDSTNAPCMMDTRHENMV